MRFLSLITPDLRQVACIDLSKPKRDEVIDAIYYANKYALIGIISNYKKPLGAAFKRNQTGDLLASDTPQRLTTEQVLERLQSLLVRGKDKQPRKMHPNSLSNLKPAKPFEPGCSVRRPRLVTDALLDRAMQLRSQGCSWKRIGDILGVKAGAVRMAQIRKDKIADTSEKIRLCSHQKTEGTYNPTGSL